MKSQDCGYSRMRGAANMETIWKYNLYAVDEPQAIYVPSTAKVLHVAMQHGELAMWIRLTTTHAIAQERWFKVVGTGHTLPENTVDYVGTAVGDVFVWHVFEVKAPRDE